MSSQKNTFSNGLTAAQLERLAILAEEFGEAQQCIGKILRHGYESYNPLTDTMDTQTSTNNRKDFERELGDVYAAIEMLMDGSEVSAHAIGQRMIEKKRTVKRWLHHQEEA